ncbi:MAG: RNA methyltransferase [Acidobacteria bacterium]|nr:RNA methyltransferase [Acidobacteriota bacterium]
MKKRSVFSLLSPFMEEERKKRFKEVIRNRTKGVVLVLENLHDPHNLSAILRSAEAFGIQHIYLTGQYPEEINKAISLGSENWITIIKEPNLKKLIRQLRQQGYLIGATLPSSSGIDPKDYKEKKPVALLLGNEHSGLTQEAVKSADLIFTIPHSGFVKSLNVSVTAAICAYSLLKKRFIKNCRLAQKEKNALLDLWALRSVPNAERILKEVKKRNRNYKT